MARRAKIKEFPDDIRRQVDERLVAKGFADYEGLEAWLRDLGFEISKSALGRYGKALKGEYDEAMAGARELLALTRAAGDLGEAGSEIAGGSAVILQTEIVKTTLDIRREEDPAKRAGLLAKLTRAQADIGRMAITVEKYREEVRTKVAAKLDAMESAAKQAGGKAGFDLDTLRRVREEIYGIV